MGLTTQCFSATDKKCANIFTTDNQLKGNINLQEFIPAMLADDRAAMPRRYLGTEPGRSTIYISRVSAGDCNTAIRFTK
jgi:hypothetical protein